MSEQNYFISTPKHRKSSRLCHVNLLKPYYSRDVTVAPESSVQSLGFSPVLTIGSVSSALQAPGMVDREEVNVRAPDDPMMCGRLKNSETLCNLRSLYAHLSDVKSSELTEMIREYPGLFGDTPSRTHLIEHDINVGDSPSI